MRKAIDFIRSWLLLHISLRINISLASYFFIKLLKLPMSFFETKLMEDLMQCINDHSRVNNFLTQQTLGITFAMFSFIVFSVVLFIYNYLVFAIFIAGSVLYGGWMTLFMKRRKVVYYELFEQQAINNNKTYEFITSIQEIKLQNSNCAEDVSGRYADKPFQITDVSLEASADSGSRYCAHKRSKEHGVYSRCSNYLSQEQYIRTRITSSLMKRQTHLMPTMNVRLLIIWTDSSKERPS